jgi:hypothetical protein
VGAAEQQLSRITKDPSKRSYADDAAAILSSIYIIAGSITWGIVLRMEEARPRDWLDLRDLAYAAIAFLFTFTVAPASLFSLTSLFAGQASRWIVLLILSGLVCTAAFYVYVWIAFMSL